MKKIGNSKHLLIFVLLVGAFFLPGCGGSQGEADAIVEKDYYLLPFFPGADFPYTVYTEKECWMCRCNCVTALPFTCGCDCPAGSKTCSEEDKKKINEEARFSILNEKDRKWLGDYWKDEYPGFKDGYIYDYNGAYCREETYPVFTTAIVKPLKWSGHEGLWVFDGKKIEKISLEDKPSIDFSKEITNEEVRKFLIRSEPSNFLEYNGNLIIAFLDFPTYSELVTAVADRIKLMYGDLHTTIWFSESLDVKNDQILATLSSELYRKKYGKILFSGALGRVLELFDLSNGREILLFPDLIPNHYDAGGLVVKGKLFGIGFSKVKGVFLIDNELFVSMRIGLLTVDSEFVRMIVPLRFFIEKNESLLSIKNHVGRLSTHPGYYLVEPYNFFVSKLADSYGNSFVKFKVLKGKDALKEIGDKITYPRGYVRQLVGLEKFTKTYEYFLVSGDYEMDKYEDHQQKVTTFKGCFKFPDEDYKTCDWVEFNGISANLMPLDNGSSLYFQDEYNKSSGIFSGIGKLKETWDHRFKITHLRSDIPPANTVDFPPEGDWDDNRLYVTGDGRYALVVPIHFPKKCLTDNLDDCIYCNRDISPNVWDFGSFNKIYVYNLTDATQPPVEIDVTGYDSYLVPSPDHMQFAFSMGDRIGILDGKTLQVRVVEMR